jgi:hypothetical protein
VTVNDLPPFHGPRPKTQPRVRRTSDWPVLSWNRGQFVKASVGAAIGVGLASVGVLPPARRAFASHAGTAGYEIKPLPCPSYAADHNCSPGCGPSEVDSRACVGSSSNHYYGWHRAGCASAYGFDWKLRPNGCVSGTGWDGWRWEYNALCGCCTSVTYRCHDGYRCNSSCANCSRTICRWITACTPRPSCA